MNAIEKQKKFSFEILKIAISYLPKNIQFEGIPNGNDIGTLALKP
jgi:hypothetical protein